MMLSFRKLTPGPGLELMETARPGPPEAGEVLVSVSAVGICGSDLHVMEWTGGYDFMVPHLPVTLGHEFAGTVEAVGPGVTGVQPGDRVAVWPSSPCEACAPCAAGEVQNCLNKRTVGLYRDGAFAPFVVARANGIFRLPEAMDFELAALAEPLCVGRRAVEVGTIRPGQKVLILGPGTIGQAIALFAREAGAAEVGIAGFDDALRLGVCNDLGFADTFDLSDPAQRQAMIERFDGCHVVFEATGRPESVHDALSLLRKEGVLVLAGIHAEPVTLELASFVRRKLQVRASHGSMPADWPAVIEAIERLGPALRPMISHRLPLDRIDEGFALARNRAAAKVMILPQEQTASGDLTP